MLQLLARRLRGAPSTSSLPLPATCERCRIATDKYALIHTSAISRWRTREERRLALHANDDDYNSWRSRRRRTHDADREDDDGRQHYARPSYPRRRTSLDSHRPAEHQRRPQREYERRPREYERPASEERPSANPYKKQLRRDRESLGVFEQASKGPEYPAHLQRDKQKFPPGTTNEERLRIESRDKINAAFNLAKELPPLTDEDYRQVYEELLTYDPAPLSPTQTRLALAAASSTPLLTREASRSAEDRLSELLTRLNRRVPEGEVPLTPLPGKEEDGEGSLASRLMRLRMEDATATTTAAPSTASRSKTLSSVLETATSEDGVTESESSGSQSGVPDSWTIAESTSTSASSSLSSSSTRPQSNVSRHHARQRGKIFHALSQLLRPTPGTKPEPKKLMIGEQPTDVVKIDLATKQEWSALVLEASNDRNLTDLLTTFELMRRAGAAVSEDLLAASIRLLSKDQKLIPILLRYFEQNGIRIPASAHHEVVIGLLQNSPASTPTTKAERYLRALEQNNTPALSKTYAAVISHIFHSRSRSGIRSRAWNLYGHMRLVAHPTPTVEVFDAMIYGCSLDDRASPERALDLFTEMTESGIKPSYNTYLGLIRSCARDKDKESPFYHEALRLLKELLERGFQPEKDIFNCILEGARSRGDIGRAKWIVANMLQISSRLPLLDPKENPLAPDYKTFNSLFLTAATYRPPNPRKKDIKLEEIQGGTAARSEEDGVNVNAEHEQTKEDTSDAISSQASTSTSAEQAESDIEASSSTMEHSPSASPEDTAAQSAHDIYMQSETGLPNEDAYPPPQHPLYRPDIPLSPHQLLDDFKQIMGTLLEVHNYPTDILEVQPTSDSSIQADSNTAGTNLMNTQDRHTTHYSKGLDEGTIEVLRNIPLNNIILNAYMTLLNAHGRSSLALTFFKKAFYELRVKYTHQSWEIIFESLDSSSRQRTKEERTHARALKASQTRELFALWEEWLKNVLINEERYQARSNSESASSSSSSSAPSATRTWFARHVEAIYAHAIGVHARAEQVDEGMKILEEFRERFPPHKIVEAAEKQEITSGPGYLVQLSSFLYPETMDSYTMNAGDSNLSERARNMTGGKRIRTSLPKSQINNYNLFGLPPLLSYQMVYSLFHRLREEEDNRNYLVLKYLNEYRNALKKALMIRETLEKQSKIGKGKEVDIARKEIIGGGAPGRSAKLVKDGRQPSSISEVLSEPEKKERVEDLLRLSSTLSKAKAAEDLAAAQ